jgi:hypothetical protein
MTEQEINVAIAKSSGVAPVLDEWWVYSESRRTICMNGIQKECLEWMARLPEDSIYNQSDWELIPHYRYPDYCHDLNAMHEAWLTLNTVERAKFAEELAYVVLNCYNFPNKEFVFSRCSLAVFANADSPARAKAFLRVKGLLK